MPEIKSFEEFCLDLKVEECIYCKELGYSASEARFYDTSEWERFWNNKQKFSWFNNVTWEQFSTRKYAEYEESFK